jgi:hypothetical protein
VRVLWDEKWFFSGLLYVKLSRKLTWFLDEFLNRLVFVHANDNLNVFAWGILVCDNSEISEGSLVSHERWGQGIKKYWNLSKLTHHMSNRQSFLRKQESSICYFTGFPFAREWQKVRGKIITNLLKLVVFRKRQVSIYFFRVAKSMHRKQG